MVKASSLLILICLALLGCGQAPGESSDGGVSKSLDDLFSKLAVSGFSGEVLYADGAGDELQSAYGVSGCTGGPIERNQVYLIGSIVKVFTRLAIYHLVDEGRLSLDDLMSAHLDGVPEDKRSITVGMLASHRSGLADIVGEDGVTLSYSPDWDYLPVSKQEIIERAMQSALIYPPDTDRQYSNLGYSLLAAIIESTSGASYEAYLRSRIFEPLGMLHTGYVLPDWSETTLVNGCYRNELWQMPISADRWMADGPSWNLRGNGGMMGTAGDLMIWLKALQGGDFLSPQIRQEYLSRVIGHSKTFQEPATVAAGGNGIFNSYYLLLADSDLKLVMISNHGDYQVERYLDMIFPILDLARNTSGSQ